MPHDAKKSAPTQKKTDLARPTQIALAQKTDLDHTPTHPHTHTHTHCAGQGYCYCYCYCYCYYYCYYYCYCCCYCYFYTVEKLGPGGGPNRCARHQMPGEVSWLQQVGGLCVERLLRRNRGRVRRHWALERGFSHLDLTFESQWSRDVWPGCYLLAQRQVCL